MFDDPDNPVLLNEWLLSSGLAHYQPPTAPATPSTDEGLVAAQDEAKANQRGVWGDCTVPASIESNTTLAPAGSLLFEASSGNQVVPFEISLGATYQLAVDVYGSPSIFIAVDVYRTDGTWIPELSIISSESGKYSSAAYLDPGSYYVQVKAVGSWRISLTDLQG